MTTSATASRSFGVSHATPARVRRWLDRTLAPLSGVNRFAARAVMSELVTDAVRRRPGRIVVDLEVGEGRVWAQVADAESELVEVADDAEERALRHHVVEMLTARWGTEADRARTATWFEIAKSPDSEVQP